MIDLVLLHPKLVHFAIALIPVSILLDFIGIISKNEKFHWAAKINLVFAAIGTLAAVISGLVAADYVPHGGGVHALMETHETWGLVTLALVVALLSWRLFTKTAFPEKAGWLYFIIGVCSITTLTVGADIGGKMVFTHGVAVKAMPQTGNDDDHHSSGNDDGHHSEDPDHHAPADAIPESADTSEKNTVADSIKAKDVHLHKDGSKHVH